MPSPLIWGLGFQEGEGGLKDLNQSTEGSPIRCWWAVASTGALGQASLDLDE